MANITLMGASYTDVPAVDLPKTGGGTVRFYENGGTNQDYEDALTAFGVQSNLASGITALTTYANEITGESDTTLSDAVRSLADGYGHGNDNWEYTWDYESGNTQKPLFLEGTASDATDSLLIVKPQMTIAFDNCELEVVAKMGVTDNSRPQLGAGTATSLGFKVFFQADTGYVRSNVTGSYVNYTSDNGFHKIKLKWQNRTATLYVDDVQVASGTGSTSQNFNGIGTNAGTTMSNTASMYFKSIKYRRL